MRLLPWLTKELEQESQDWVAEGIISRQQAEQIVARYAADDRESLGYRLLVVLGFGFVGLALIVLIGANWEEIPRALRMGSLLLLTALVQSLAIRAHVGSFEERAVGYFFLGNIIYGASIILIAQIYHLGEHMPDGVFWWALGCAPFAILTVSRLLLLQTLVLAYIWFMLEADLGYYPAAMPVFIAAGVYVLGRCPNFSAVLGLMVAVMWVLWIYFTAGFAWHGDLDAVPEHFLLLAASLAFLYGFGIYLAGTAREVWQAYGVLLQTWVLRTVLVVLLYFTFAESWRDLLQSPWPYWRSALLCSAGLWATGLLLAYRGARLVSLLWFAGLYVLVCLGLVVFDETQVVIPQVVANLAAVGCGVWLIFRGVESGVGDKYWTGVMLILLIALFRYFDLIGDYVGGALLFFAIAAVLLGAARFWKSRHTLPATRPPGAAS